MHKEPSYLRSTVALLMLPILCFVFGCASLRHSPNSPLIESQKKAAKIFRGELRVIEKNFSVSLDINRAAVATTDSWTVAHVPVTRFKDPRKMEFRDRERLFSALAIHGPGHPAVIYGVSLVRDESNELSAINIVNETGKIVESIGDMANWSPTAKVRDPEFGGGRERPSLPVSISNLRIRRCIYFDVDVGYFGFGWDIFSCYDCGEIMHCRRKQIEIID